MIIHSSKTFLDDSGFNDAYIIIKGRKIVKVILSKYINNYRYINKNKIIECGKNILSPGFIDIHIHGGKGSDFMDADEKSFNSICKYHAGGGTTSLLVTTTSDSYGAIVKVLKQTEKFIGLDTSGANILGVHLEGPFFNPEMRGCHLPEYIRNPSDREVDKLLEHKDIIKSITIAPEIQGAINTIKKFRNAGILVSAGHTNATYNEMIKSITYGVRHTTHFSNAMSFVVKNGPYRVPGVVETVLLRDDLTTEIISDGFHVHPERIKLLLKMKGCNKVCLITDAMRGVGMPDGLYAFGAIYGKKSIVKNSMSIMQDGTGFASSVISMNDAVKKLISFASVSIEDALRMASYVPSRVIGLDDYKGKIKEGYDADFVVLNSNFDVLKTIVGGKEVFNSKKNSKKIPCQINIL